jgi:hypothetical protein
MATLFYSETVLLLAFSSVFAGTGAEEVSPLLVSLKF